MTTIEVQENQRSDNSRGSFGVKKNVSFFEFLWVRAMLKMFLKRVLAFVVSMTRSNARRIDRLVIRHLEDYFGREN